MSQPQTASTRFCDQCAAPLPGTARFCGLCGAPAIDQNNLMVSPAQEGKQAAWLGVMGIASLAGIAASFLSWADDAKGYELAAGRLSIAIGVCAIGATGVSWLRPGTLSVARIISLAMGALWLVAGLDRLIDDGPNSSTITVLFAGTLLSATSFISGRSTRTPPPETETGSEEDHVASAEEQQSPASEEPEGGRKASPTIIRPGEQESASEEGDEAKTEEIETPEATDLDADANAGDDPNKEPSD